MPIPGRLASGLTIGLVALALVALGDYFATSELLEFSVFFLLPTLDQRGRKYAANVNGLDEAMWVFVSEMLFSAALD